MCQLSLLLLLLLLSALASPILAQRAVACDGNVFNKCKDYCFADCLKDDFGTCMMNCDNGCGCTDAKIIRNNGGCRQLKLCTLVDTSDEAELQTVMAEATTQRAPALINENGDDHLNLIEFTTINAFA
ncbi:uncharacterized protein LOC108595957 [Drosophila busckii]|uniref:uncharacterized protein LOC108595957 n=1 Tax=Drosophila busckii TaxID=30019 RepID=UPI00083F3D22|nr:uncharacterized protein LOC108595957 [Drosophila busckii]